MRNINELAEHDTKWRTIATNITGNKSAGDDLVQDMYLKLMDVDKNINDYYVTMTLKSIFIDGIRKSKVDSHDVGVENEEYVLYGAGTWEEAEDNAGKKFRPRQAMVGLRAWMDIASGHGFEADDEQQALLDIIYAQPYQRREFLEESYDRSIREIAAIFGINYGFIYKDLHKLLDETLGEDKEELYNNSNMKIRKATKNK